MSIADELFARVDQAWAEQPAGAGLLTGRCEIFGPADVGPRHLQGGRFGPEFNGRIHWHCQNPQDMRVRIHCKWAHSMGECAGHCGPRTIPVCNGHFAMFHKRLNKACTKCSQPQVQLDLEQDYYNAGYEFELARRAGDARRCEHLAVRLEDIQQAMAELVTRGVVRKCELFMIEVS